MVLFFVFLSLFIFDDIKGRTAVNTLKIVKKNSSIFIFLVIVSSKTERKRDGTHALHLKQISL